MHYANRDVLYLSFRAALVSLIFLPSGSIRNPRAHKWIQEKQRSSLESTSTASISHPHCHSIKPSSVRQSPGSTMGHAFYLISPHLWLAQEPAFSHRIYDDCHQRQLCTPSMYVHALRIFPQAQGRLDKVGAPSPPRQWRIS